MSKYYRKKLNDGDNLNVKLGPYGSASNNIVGSLLNKPTQVLNGEVTIDWYPSNDNSNYGTQILRHTRDNTINIYFRAKKGSVDNWSEWINLATKNDLPQFGLTPGIDCASNTVTEFKVTFPKAFSKAPVVIATPISNTTGINGIPKYAVWNVTTTGFTIRIYNDDSGQRSPAFCWMAMAQS